MLQAGGEEDLAVGTLRGKAKMRTRIGEDKMKEASAREGHKDEMKV